MSNIRIGLVLSGGGAKGAYQVGVIKALAELGANVDAISGASIGALNGAILASSPTLKDGAERLEKVWNLLAYSSPLSPNTPNYLNLLVSAGLHLGGLDYIHGIAAVASHLLGTKCPIFLKEWLAIGNTLNSGALSDAPLHQLMDRYLDEDALQKGLPLYVSMFKSRGAIADLASCLIAEFGGKDSPQSDFIHIQSLSVNESREALLGSAAIPLLFTPKQIDDSLYSDGGQGGWKKMQGNTPITPLLVAGYRTIIVTHLTDGSLWSRQDFPDATILEIRPTTAISRTSGASDLLGFDVKKIPSWINQGYTDTIHCIGRVMTASKARGELRVSEAAIKHKEACLDRLENDMEKSMQQLR